ncbi:hypothetical protein LCGC14_2603380 [marine sediment metagenome]|uniref:HMA domain-containing protein n=1 Tax=marine sediment metagenome TaxID=412755 RepID=A0A0F9D0U9_9ZZZZ
MKRRVMVSMLVSALALFSFVEPVKAEIERITLRVDGLACPFCAYGLEKKITKIKGVRSYDVDMKEGKVFIGLKPDARVELNTLYKAVKEAGFTLRSISLRVKGKIQQSREGLVLVAKGSRERLLLFEIEAIYQKYHQGEIPKTLRDKLEKRLIQLKESGKEVLIEGVIHEHKGLPLGLSVDHLEIVE